MPGNLVEEYRAGMIATASPFTGFQPSAEVRALSIIVISMAGAVGVRNGRSIFRIAILARTTKGLIPLALIAITALALGVLPR